MNQRSRNLPRALQAPIRDVLRGVSTAAEITEELLKPATPLLPKPVRSLFTSTLKAVEAAGQAELRQPLDPADIECAVEFLNGTDSSKEHSSTFLRVLVNAWDRSRAINSPSPVHISETLASMSIRGSGDSSGASGHARAAEIIVNLRTSHCIGRVPGTPLSLNSEDQRQTDLDLAGIFVWLLAERDQSADDEERLLQLATALVHTLQEEVLEQFGDTAALAEELRRLAAFL